MTLRLRTQDLTWQELDGEIVVLDLRSSTYYVINGSGTRLWLRLASDASTEELTGLLETTYELSHDVAQQDASAFVDDLRSKGLLA